MKAIKLLGKGGLLLTAALGASLGWAYERGDTIVHLSFDGTVDDVNAARGATAVYSGTPSYSADTPAATVYVSGAARANGQSLQANGNQIQLKVPGAGLLRPDLKEATIEFFIKGLSVTKGSWAVPVRFSNNPDITSQPPFPYLLQTDARDRYTFRLDGFDDAAAAAGSSANREMAFCALAQPFADDTWHHVAVTIAPTDDGKSRFKFYFDYAKVAETVSTKFAWTGLTDTMTLDFGSTSASCLIDEFRISCGALEPRAFIGANPPPADGDALLHLTFDSADLSSSARTLERPRLLSGSLDIAAQQVPGETVHARSGARANAGSLLCDGKTVQMALPLATLQRPDLTSATIELYIRCEKAETEWAVPMRVYNPQTGTTPPFPLLLQKNDNKGGRLDFRLDSCTDSFSFDGGASVTSMTHTYPYAFADGKWHHLAATVEPTAAGGTLVRYYLDHQLVGSATSETQAWKGFADFHRLSLGESGVTCWIDELRISKGVLDHTQFLNTVKPPADREVLVHLTFDGDLRSSGRADCQPTLVSGTPAYSPRGYRHRIVSSFGGGTEARENGGALRLADGDVTLTLPGVWLRRPHLTAATFEFFIKGDANATATWTNPISLISWPDSPAVPPFPLLVGTDHAGKLTARVDSAAEDFESHYNDGAYWEQTSQTLYPFNDRRWHHVALTVAPADGGLSTYTWYVDYAPVATATTATFPWQGLREGTVLKFSGRADFSSTVDEFRICRGVLSPDEFLRKGPSGLAIVVR